MILILETSSPFHAPQRTPASTAMSTAAVTLPPSDDRMRPSTTEQAIAPEIAMTDPTEMSVPPVASTIVMPVASSMSLEPLRRMSMSLP